MQFVVVATMSSSKKAAADARRRRRKAEEMEDLQKELDLVDHGTAWNGQRRRQPTKQQAIQQTQTRRLLEKKDDWNRMEEGDVSQPRIRGSMAAEDDRVIQGSLVFGATNDHSPRSMRRGKLKKDDSEESSEEDENDDDNGEEESSVESSAVDRDLGNEALADDDKDEEVDEDDDDENDDDDLDEDDAGGDGDDAIADADVDTEFEDASTSPLLKRRSTARIATP